jgi:NADPH-dependent ferric siderophore reductase
MSLKDRVAGLVLKPAEVTSVERLSEHVTRIGLGLRAGTWAPGAKIQVAVDGTTLRTYTPVATDEGAELIAFAHGDGPGARWARTVAPGPVRVFGPRGSLDLTTLVSPVVFVGDETSVGLALALRGLD